MSSDESKVHFWENQQEESIPSTPSSLSSCQGILTTVSISIVNPVDLDRLANMELDMEEVESHGNSEGDNQEEWGASSHRSVVTGNMLATWRAKYAIPSSIIMIIPGLSDRPDVRCMGCFALNLAILHIRLRLPIPRVVHKFFFILGYSFHSTMS